MILITCNYDFKILEKYINSSKILDCYHKVHIGITEYINWNPKLNKAHI